MTGIPETPPEHDENAPLVYVGHCPLGEQCSKKGSHLKTCASEEEARAALVHHLRYSPYHELDSETAMCMAQVCEISSWKQEAAKKKPDEDDSSWWDSRKRKWQDESWRSGSSSRQSGDGWGSGWAYHDAMQQPAQALHLQISGATAHTKQITLSKTELQACIDSLKRAKTALTLP